MDIVTAAWECDHSNSNIRNLYNYIKHKGKPQYRESEEILGKKAIQLWIDKEEYPSDIRDVQKSIGLEDGIKELIDFDDNLLFPYVDRLIRELKIAINPSPMAYM